MLLYRVFPYLSSAKPGAAGHALYLHRPQGAGRWDNPTMYDTWYLSTTAEGAIVETFGNLQTWSAGMFDTPFLAGGKRVLGVFSVPDDLSILDLDDAQNLLRQGMRPTQVVIRNLAYTQGRASAVFGETLPGGRRWAGLSWWSYHRPFLTNVALWSTPARPAELTFVEHSALSLSTPAVIEAAKVLARPLP